nr:MAG TPA: hypothetical protein [Caudoviricetes sp.]
MHTPDKISHTISISLFEGGIVWQQTSVFSPCAYLMKSLTRSGRLQPVNTDPLPITLNLFF